MKCDVYDHTLVEEGCASHAITGNAKIISQSG